MLYQYWLSFIVVLHHYLYTVGCACLLDTEPIDYLWVFEIPLDPNHWQSILFNLFRQYLFTPFWPTHLIQTQSPKFCLQTTRLSHSCSLQHQLVWIIQWIVIVIIIIVSIVQWIVIVIIIVWIVQWIVVIIIIIVCAMQLIQ